MTERHAGTKDHDVTVQFYAAPVVAGIVCGATLPLAACLILAVVAVLLIAVALLSIRKATDYSAIVPVVALICGVLFVVPLLLTMVLMGVFSALI